MKCFERLVKSFITSSIPDSLDPLQFAYTGPIGQLKMPSPPHPPHCPLPPGPEGHICEMLFIDYSSTPSPQAVRMGSTTSSTLTLNTGAPQGCVLSPLLYSLFTHDSVATYSSNTIVKFADDTTVIGLITGDDKL
ncbi:hypothetical protein L3Q82_006635 [Scortum barcoo]|uniref:Uncharacterized protein n=1 Tax=Scortum barcoo TaxID=214431 RepID=A0ACB8X315_9TELE|nr:hypothetical protein L3Q82_006635 [Scortum barcoo]